MNAKEEYEDSNEERGNKFTDFAEEVAEVQRRRKRCKGGGEQGVQGEGGVRLVAALPTSFSLQGLRAHAQSLNRLTLGFVAVEFGLQVGGDRT